MNKLILFFNILTMSSISFAVDLQCNEILELSHESDECVAVDLTCHEVFEHPWLSPAEKQAIAVLAELEYTFGPSSKAQENIAPQAKDRQNVILKKPINHVGSRF